MNEKGSKSVIFLHVGQAGIQIGSTLWELFCLENGINENGRSSGSEVSDRKSIDPIFVESSSGKFSPRSVFVDTDYFSIDEIRTGSFRDLYNKNFLISGEECCADNFARGMFSTGKERLEITMDQIRKMSEKCDHLQGFVVTKALSGGTGSGFGSSVMQKLNEEYRREPKISYTVYSSPNISSSIVEPYNTVLCTNWIRGYEDITVLVDNEAMYRICEEKCGIERPSYRHCNQLIVQSISSQLSTVRSQGLALEIDLQQFLTNNVCFPKIHFCVTSLSPFVSNDMFETNIDKLTQEVFNSSSFLLSVDEGNIMKHKYSSISMMYRGDIEPSTILPAITNFKKRKDVQFVDWCPTGIKIGCLNNNTNTKYNPLITARDGKFKRVPIDLSTVCNSSVVADAFHRICWKSIHMYWKRAFSWWYVREGMEEGMFTESSEDLISLVKDYQELNSETLDDE